MLAPIGKWLREYREEKHLTLRDMARSIGISAAYLSAVETGRKKPSSQLVELIQKEYGLGAKEHRLLRDAADRSNVSLKIDMTRKYDIADREIAALFARNFNELTDEKKEQIRKILKD